VVPSTPPSICGPCPGHKLKCERREAEDHGPPGSIYRNIALSSMTLYQVRSMSNKGVHYSTALDRDAILQSREVVTMRTAAWSQVWPRSLAASQAYNQHRLRCAVDDRSP
jgi:hypothetical protein